MDTKKFESYDDSSFQQFCNPSTVEKDLQTLVGIIKGIRGDTVINEVENSKLLAWVNTHRLYEEKQPYKEVISKIRESLSDNILTEEESKNIIWFCNQYIAKTAYFDALTSGVQQLVGIIKGVSIDNQINLSELEYLDSWLEENDFLKNTYPYDELYSLVTRIIQDKIITEQEHTDLINFCNCFARTEGSNAELVTWLKTGFCQIDPTIILQENTFCITGNSKKFKRKEIAEKIELYGGYVVNNVSQKLNYLIVCDDKNNCWAFTCYGRKIEEAIRHRKNGARLVIVHEFDLMDTLAGME